MQVHMGAILSIQVFSFHCDLSIKYGKEPLNIHYLIATSKMLPDITKSYKTSKNFYEFVMNSYIL